MDNIVVPCFFTHSVVQFYQRAQNVHATFWRTFRYAVARPSVFRLQRSRALLSRLKFSALSTPLGILAIRWHQRNILRKSSQGNPSEAGGAVKRKRGRQSYFGPIEGYRKRCTIGGKFVIITHRNRIYELSIGTEIGDLEWPWPAPWPLFCVISPKSAPSGAHCIEVVEDTVYIPKLSAT